MLYLQQIFQIKVNVGVYRVHIPDEERDGF